MEENLYKAGTENFTLPHDVVQLPSGGIFYKSKIKSVKVGYMTANDENYLIGSSRTSDNIILTLLRNKLYEHSLRPEELLDGDIEAILIFLRNTSFGPEYVINLVDPKTDKKFTTTILLDELNIKKTEFKPDESGTFITKLPKSGVSVKLRPTNLGDTVDLDKSEAEYPEGRRFPSVTTKLLKHVVEVDGNTDRTKISSFIDSLPIMDSKYIRTFLRENQPSLDLKRTAIAPSGELVSFEITFGVDFFRPFF